MTDQSTELAADTIPPPPGELPPPPEIPEPGSLANVEPFAPVCQVCGCSDARRCEIVVQAPDSPVPTITHCKWHDRNQIICTRCATPGAFVVPPVAVVPVLSVIAQLIRQGLDQLGDPSDFAAAAVDVEPAIFVDPIDLEPDPPA